MFSLPSSIPMNKAVPAESGSSQGQGPAQSLQRSSSLGQDPLTPAPAPASTTQAVPEPDPKDKRNSTVSKADTRSGQGGPSGGQVSTIESILAELDAIKKRQAEIERAQALIREQQAAKEAARILPEPVTLDPCPPTPPNWSKSWQTAIHALSPFTRIPVIPSSREYQTLSSLLRSAPSLVPVVMERLVNCSLWKQFVNKRRELMSSKTNDLALLSGLGLTDSELQEQAHVSFNYDLAPGIPSYADNVALLFHCTRGNVDMVLSQGLDERLGRGMGLLGRGIYFTDDPLKAVAYDSNGALLVFAVLLGDCYSVDHIVNKKMFVREPEKAPRQRRNHTDLFFDSIVGRPASVNEFVIYNRHQCVPLYCIHYAKANPIIPPAAQGDTYTFSRERLPPFAWTPPQSPTPILCPNEAGRWPFFAQTLFKSMDGPAPENTVSVPQAFDTGSDQKVPEASASTSALNKNISALTSSQSQSNSDLKLTGPPEPKLRKLTDLSSITTLCNSSQSPLSVAKAEECPICCNQTTDWNVLSCSHKLCAQCRFRIGKTGKTMSGQALAFVKCPFCMAVSGTEFGTCPDGQMVTRVIAMNLPGYETYGTIAVNYLVSQGKYSLNRTGYLPDSPEGKRLLALLDIAWDRRLVFTIGTSLTTGQSDVLVWNIHHKTSPQGGVGVYGYPDPTYLDRLKDELSQYAIQ